MRTIVLNGASVVELWPGRRLHIPGSLLVSLPKGYASRNGRTVSLGSISKATVTIIGSQSMIDALWEGLVGDEKPGDGVKRLES